MVSHFVNSNPDMQLLAPLALLPGGWKTDVLMDVDKRGYITRVAFDQHGIGGKVQRLPGPVLPGIPNLHSHAFQRAMTGLTERRGPAQDDFWTWRETMYDFVSKLTPEAVEAVACQLYVELLEAGYTGVAEFHYLHHDQDGRAYADIAETSNRIVTAARTAGIFLTHLPVLYTRGGFDGAPLVPNQRRFANDGGQFCTLLEALRRSYANDNDVHLGVALHSLRAVDPETMGEVLKFAETQDARAPVHIHIAEQTREVEECIARCGARPVQWLFDNAPVDDRWCLVHATHANAEELAAIASSGAVAGLCPTTEANLGDGLFPAERYLALKGRFGIGSDSQVSTSPAEELRLLEYGQRLTARRRAVLAAGTGASVGRTLYDAAARGGAQALGVNAGAIAPGARADLVVLDTESAALCARNEDALLDALIFFGGKPALKEVWVAGRRVVSEGRHPRRAEVLEGFKSALNTLN